jgi:ubiquinone/menaquinone biosynthesis C-methylase UbiE
MPTREETIVENTKPFLRRGQSVVEIGAGNGLVAQMLHDATGADFTLLDVVDYNRSKLPMHIFDGTHLPFKDDEFDLAMLVFVLHHNPDPRPVMEQALRVARQGVIVVENDVRGMIKKPLTRMIDSTEYLRRGVPPCYFTKSADEWHTFFRGLPAHVETLHTFKIGLYWNNVVMKVETKTSDNTN